MRLFWLLLFATLSLSAQLPKDSVFYAKRAARETTMIPVCEGKYNVFTQKWGDGKIKLPLVHAGPGHGHEYSENFSKALKRDNVTLYYYDQLGAYFSNQPDDAAIWNCTFQDDQSQNCGLSLFGWRPFSDVGRSRTLFRCRPHILYQVSSNTFSPETF